MDREVIHAEIDALRPWFHNLHLPDGSQTAPDHFLGDFPAYKWAEVAPWFPDDMRGWRVLDIGCNAGYYSFELARRGARVTALDVNPHYLAQARWAAGIFNLEDRIEFRQGQVYELAGWPDDSFELVLFLGVFYHLRYPLLGLDIVSRLTRSQLLFQTLAMPGEEVFDPGPDRGINEREAMLAPGWPKMAFIERRLSGDPTNWWAANHAGIVAMLRSAGLKVVGRPGTEIYLCEPDPANPPVAATWGAEEFRAATGLSRLLS